MFYCSGAQKLQSFNVTTGGPVMSLMAPKMDTFLGHIKDIVKVDIPLEKVHTSKKSCFLTIKPVIA